MPPRAPGKAAGSPTPPTPPLILRGERWDRLGGGEGEGEEPTAWMCPEAGGMQTNPKLCSLLPWDQWNYIIAIRSTSTCFGSFPCKNELHFHTILVHLATNVSKKVWIVKSNGIQSWTEFHVKFFIFLLNYVLYFYTNTYNIYVHVKIHQIRTWTPCATHGSQPHFSSHQIALDLAKFRCEQTNNTCK